MRLAETQSHFRDAIVNGDVHDLESSLVGGQNPEKRLKVHQRNYQTSLVEALLVKFPATGWLVGTQFLKEAARQFVREYPPQGPCITEYGATFPEFLAQCPGTERVPYVHEFAQLEWYVGQVAIAVDRAAINREEFSTIDASALPDTLLSLQPGLHYLHTSWPVDELMKLYLTETAPDQFAVSAGDRWIEVRGARGEFHFTPLDKAEFIFRASVADACAIGDAAEYALDVNPKFDPGRALAALIAAGLVIAIAHQGEDA